MLQVLAAPISNLSAIKMELIYKCNNALKIYIDCHLIHALKIFGAEATGFFFGAGFSLRAGFSSLNVPGIPKGSLTVLDSTFHNFFLFLNCLVTKKKKIQGYSLN